MSNINNQEIVTPKTTELVSNLRDANDTIEISYWLETLKKYEKTINSYNILFQEKQLIRDILPNIKNNDIECSLLDYVIALCQKKERTDLYLNGVGGSGKTVSLIYLCKELLEKNIPALYIPLSHIDDSGSEIRILSKWIRNRVLVLDNKFPEIDTTAKYEKMLVSINTSVNMPFVLVLDGINEMKNPHRLLKELEIWNSLENVIIIVSSRNNDFFNVGNATVFNYCEILPLSETTILEYLRKRKLLTGKETPKLKIILSIPQMLALYVGTSTIKEKYYHAKGLDWRDNNCISDIIHNYIVCQIAEVVYEKQLCSCYLAIFTMKYVIPKLAWVIYNRRNNYIDRKSIRESINQLIKEVNSRTIFPDDLENVSKPYDVLEIREILFFLLDQLTLFDEFDNSEYCFVHQNYFDYFLSLYWINCAILSMEFQETTCWNKDIIPTSVEFYFSETEGRICCSDFGIINNYWEFLRKRKLFEDDLCLFNLLRIMEQRYNWNLSSLDFSDLDLRHICLNGIVLSDGGNVATFRNSMISEYTFSPQGHHAAITQTFFFSEKPNILYTKDLHGNMGMYDIETDKRILMKYGELYGGRKQILLAGSNPDTFLVPHIHSFLGETLMGMNKVNADTQEVEYISAGINNIMESRSLQYMGENKKWIVLSGNRININDYSKIAPNAEECIWKIDEEFRFYKLIENKKQSVFIFSLISNNTPYKEQLIKYQVNSGKASCIYFGDVIVGIRQTYLSDDGMFLAISDKNAMVTVVETEKCAIIKKLYHKDKVVTNYKGYVLISPDNQWCVWYGQTGKSFYPWTVFIWNLWKSDVYLLFEYNDIISSSCFALDSKRLILGMFDGSIDIIELLNFDKHRLAVGHRVDQKMFVIDNILYVRRSDDYYHKWDVEKQIILEAPKKYSFSEQKIYNISEWGRKWFSTNFKILKVWDSELKNVKEMGAFTDENRLFSNEVNSHILEIEYDHSNMGKIKYCMHNIDTNLSSEVEHIFLQDISNEAGSLKKIYLTNDRTYLVILFQKELFGREGITIWNLKKRKTVFLHWFENKTIYMDQKYDISDCENIIMICFHHPIHFYIINIEESTIEHYDMGYTSCRLFSSRSSEDIRCISVKEEEDTQKQELRGSLMIAPDGTIITDSKQGYSEGIFEHSEKTIPVGAMQIYLGEAMGSLLFTKNTAAICCEMGMIVIAEFSQKEVQILLLNESDYRATDVKVINIDTKYKYLLSAQKDDNIYIWELNDLRYLGYLRSIPGTNIYECDFQDACFDSESIKKLVAMNGGLIT